MANSHQATLHRSRQPGLTADEVLKALSIHDSARNSFFTTNVRSGPSQGGWSDELGQRIRYFAFDGLAIARSWAHFTITIYEVKVDRQDFLRDAKWPEYRDYCHRLYFACPEGLIQKEELPPDVGLIWYKAESKTLRMQRACAHRQIEVPWELLAIILFSHLDTDRYPFFSTKRDYFERWMKERKIDQRFSYEFKGALKEAIKKAANAQEDADRRIAQVESEVENLRKASEILKANGMDLRGYGWAQELDARLKGGSPQNLRRQVEWIAQCAADILQSLPKEQAKAGGDTG